MIAFAFLSLRIFAVTGLGWAAVRLSLIREEAWCVLFQLCAASARHWVSR